MTWYGTDPGGINAFGVAALEEDGFFETWLCSSVDESLTKIAEPKGVGIDCPLWWSSETGGGRFADRWLRKTYRIAPGTVQSANSLKGAVLTQGLTLAILLRRSYPDVPITESHPKALILALRLTNWGSIRDEFGLRGSEPKTMHERDALIGAVAAREGSLGRWKLDLALHRGSRELGLEPAWFGAINYWWPAEDASTQAASIPPAARAVELPSAAPSKTEFKRCPECDREFRGKGWEGIDAHWKAKHQDVMSYEQAWPSIIAGSYISTNRR